MMRLKETALANAAGTLGAIFFLGCYGLVLVAPEIYKGVAQSWMHGVDISTIWSPRTGNVILGFTSFTVTSWISGWVLARLYNNFVK
jgi:hypothetical protein